MDSEKMLRVGWNGGQARSGEQQADRCFGLAGGQNCADTEQVFLKPELLFSWCNKLFDRTQSGGQVTTRCG